MANLNKVMLIGNLTRDPEVRYTPSGMAVADLRLAVNRRYRSADGQEHEETCFVNVTVWAKQAENCGQYLKKGRPVFIEGRLKFDEWEKDGQKLNRLSVVAERVQFLGDGGGRGAVAAQDGDVPARGPVADSHEPRRETVSGGAGQEVGEDEEDGREPLGTDTDNLPF